MGTHEYYLNWALKPAVWMKLRLFLYGIPENTAKRRKKISIFQNCNITDYSMSTAVRRFLKIKLPEDFT
ncbi:MAG: hypothetical protein AB2L14_35325 [Candidatus Xenobiia bacterium LiM19]